MLTKHNVPGTDKDNIEVEIARYLKGPGQKEVIYQLSWTKYWN